MPPWSSPLDFAAHWLLFALVGGAAFLYVRRARAAPSRLRMVAGNGLVFLALLTGLFACGETYMRYGYDRTTWHYKALTTQAWFWRHARELNRDGYRDVGFSATKPPGRVRIAFIGDSFTFGYGVRDVRDRFSDRVRAALDERSPGRFEVWNVGSIGADTKRELTMLRTMLARHRVDRVVLAYSPNDVEDLLPLARHDIAPFEGAEPGSLRSRSFLLDHLIIRASLLDTSRTELFFSALDAFHRDPKRFAAQAARMQEFAAACRASAVKLDVIVFPLISHWGPDYPFDAWHARIAEAWTAAGVEVIDLREAFAGRTSADLRASDLDAHPNELANALVANEILRLLF